jgi:galactokinase
MPTVGQVASWADNGASIVGGTSHVAAEEVIHAKAALFAAAARQLLQSSARTVTPEANCRLAWVPGRVELAGKHTDYAGGRTSRSLVFAVPLGIAVVAVDRTDDILVVHSRDQRVDVSLVATSREGGDNEHKSSELDGWEKYVHATARRLANNFGAESRSEEHDEGNVDGGLLGSCVGLASDLPSASGMSSSSALVCAIFLVLCSCNALADHPLYIKHFANRPGELSQYLGCIENGQSFAPSTHTPERNAPASTCDNKSSIQSTDVASSSPRGATASSHSTATTTKQAHVRNETPSCVDTASHAHVPEVLGGTVAGGVGTFGGSEDHAAIMFGKQDHILALSFSCQSTRIERYIRVPPQCWFVIAVSGVQAHKASAELMAFNRIALRARQAAVRLCASSSYSSGTDGGGHSSVSLGSLATTLLTADERFQLPMNPTDEVELKVEQLLKENGLQTRSGANEEEEAILRRATQFVCESCVVVPACIRAFDTTTQEDRQRKAGGGGSSVDWELLSDAAVMSQRLAQTHLMNTAHETCWLPEAACRLGAKAASSFGAGFGGSCWAAVEGTKEVADDIAKVLLQEYREQYPQRTTGCQVFVCRPCAGAFILP